MSTMSEMHSDLETIRRVMEDDVGEPFSPKEVAEYRVAMAVRDCFLASGEIYKLRCDRIAGPFIAQAEADLWTIKRRIDEMLTEIRIDRGEYPLPADPVVVGFRR